MEWKKFARGGAFGLLLIAIGGCYEYKAPPAATLGETYTRRDRDKADELLNGIWENYSLSEAEKICFPEYRKIIGLSQYPIVQSWIKMLEAGIHTEKICDLLHLIANQN